MSLTWTIKRKPTGTVAKKVCDGYFLIVCKYKSMERGEGEADTVGCTDKTSQDKMSHGTKRPKTKRPKT